MGNRQSILLRPNYQLADTSNYDNGSHGDYFENPYPFPLIIFPHEMKIVDLKLSLNELNFELGKTTDSVKFQSFCGLNFYGLDSKANIIEGSTGFQVEINTDKKDIRSVLPANHSVINPYKPTIIKRIEYSKKNSITVN